MRQTSNATIAKTLLGPFILLQGLMVLLVLFRALHEPIWSQYDWEINYSAGFVRRGLFGEVLRQLHLLPHASAAFVITVLASYLVVFWCVWRLAQQASWNLPLALLIYSPAALGFTLLSPNRIGCKEVLFVALIAFTAVVPVHDWLVSAALAVAMLLLVLTHEVAAFYVPYFFAVFWLRTGQNWRRAIVLFAAPALVTLVTFLAVSTHKGTSAQAQAICQSIGGTSLKAAPCDGAIHYLTNTSAEAHESTLQFSHYFHFWLEIPYILVLALLPVGLLLRSLHARDATLALRCTAFLAVAWVITTPLFWFATDWDRWIYMHIFSTMILALLLFRKGQEVVVHA